MRRLGLTLVTFLTLVLSVSARERTPGRGSFTGAILSAAPSPRTSDAIPVADHRFQKVQGKGFWARGGAGLLVHGGARGVELSALSRSGRPWMLGLGLTGFGRDGRLQKVGPGTPGLRGDGLEISRTRLIETYRNGSTGVQVDFRIERAPEGKPRNGQVTLEIGLAGGLSATAAEDGASIRFHDLLGRLVLESSRLGVIDAAGRDIPAVLVPGDGAIQIQIDDAGAVYPIQAGAMLSAPAGTLSGEGGAFGRSVAGAGDVNGDGHGDVIVAAPGYDNGGFRFGRAYLFLGSAAGIESASSWVVEGSETGHGFASVVSGAGDLNGDGFGDVVVSGVSGALAYFGSAFGLSLTPDWTSPVPEEAPGYGVAVAGAGDVNGDGFSDLLVGGQQQVWVGGGVSGRAELYLGSASGPGASPAWTSEGDQPEAAFGYALASAGDVNADGYGDVIIGEPAYDYPNPVDRPKAGKVLVYLGTSAGLSAAPVWESDLVNRFAFLGASVSGAGDVNGDGYDDIVMGGFNGFFGEHGIARVYLGSPSGPADSPAWTQSGDHLYAHLGTAVAGAGDLNGDGYADVIIGEPDYDRSEYEESVGRAYLFRGSPDGLEVDPSWFDEGDVPFVLLGSAVASAGDVNGDGTGDLLVGAPSNGRDTGRVFIYAGAPDNRPPEARITAPEQVECASPAGAVVSLSGSASSDPDSTPGTRDDIRLFEWFEHYGEPGQVLLGSGESLSVTLPSGGHRLTLRATDLAGATGLGEALVTIADTTPPRLTVGLSPSMLWPPTHRMVPIHATVGLSDACGPAAATLISILSDEPDDAPGTADGSTRLDVQESSPGTLDLDFKLRAERSEEGDGRVYMVTYRAADAAGNPSTVVAFVTVPSSFKGIGRAGPPQQNGTRLLFTLRRSH